MPPTKKKTRVIDDEDVPAKKKKKAKAVVEDEDVDDDDEEEEEDDADTEDEDDDEEEEEDDDDSDSDDDEEEDEDEEDSDDDDEDEDDDSSASGISWDPDDAEGGGLPEGRVVLCRPRTRFASTANYNEDDADSGVPVLTIDCVPVTKSQKVEADPFTIHLTAGKRDRIVPTSDGTDFEPAEDSKAKGLSKGSNTFLFIKSLEDAGLPKEKLRAKGLRVLAGMEIDLVRVDQPKRRGLAADNDEDAGPRTVPNAASIFCFPWEKKRAAAREAAEAALHTGKKGKGKAKKGSVSAKAGAKKKGVRGKAADDSGVTASKSTKPSVKAKKLSDSEIIEEAEKAVTKALNTPPFDKKGLPVGDAYVEAFQFVKSHPQRKPIMELIADEEFLTDDDREWFYNERTGRLSTTE